MKRLKKKFLKKNDWKKLVQLSQVSIENIPETKNTIRIKNSLSQLKLMQALDILKKMKAF